MRQMTRAHEKMTSAASPDFFASSSATKTSRSPQDLSAFSMRLVVSSARLTLAIRSLRGRSERCLPLMTRSVLCVRRWMRASSHAFLRTVSCSGVSFGFASSLSADAISFTFIGDSDGSPKSCSATKTTRTMEPGGWLKLLSSTIVRFMCGDANISSSSRRIVAQRSSSACRPVSLAKLLEAWASRRACTSSNSWNPHAMTVAASRAAAISFAESSARPERSERSDATSTHNTPVGSLANGGTRGTGCAAMARKAFPCDPLDEPASM
mmetsp:Transcript_9519/g.31304  ORF Transcript_9519/g.31304 Transcript_9519/m.31304 type:complete len:267 (-) Transcript_9519:490-1290(-)